MTSLLPDALKRDPLDRYYTPDHVADCFARWLRIPGGLQIVEPSVGGGAWARAVRKHTPDARLTGFDLDLGARGLTIVDTARHGDWLKNACTVCADLVIGNPPFGAAAVDHIRASLMAAPVVALLLRSTIVEPTEGRADLIYDTPPALEWTWPKRIRFGGAAGSDSVLHSLFIWRRGHTGPWLREMCRPDVAGWMPSTSPWGPA